MMDLSRHIEVFNPNKLEGGVAVVGVGAVGSMVALELAKLGIQDITLIDGDIVESHNLCNQVLYGPEDVGKSKVHAAAERIYHLTGYEPSSINSFWKTDKLPFTYIFMCVDSMAVRKELFDNCIRFSFSNKLLLDARINAFAGQAILIERENAQQVNYYMSECLYSDAHVVDTVGGCGTPITVAATAHLASSYLMALFINYVRGVKPLTNEILFNTNPFHISSGTFG